MTYSMGYFRKSYNKKMHNNMSATILTISSYPYSIEKYWIYWEGFVHTGDRFVFDNLSPPVNNIKQQRFLTYYSPKIITCRYNMYYKFMKAKSYYVVCHIYWFKIIFVAYAWFLHRTHFIIFIIFLNICGQSYIYI